MGEEFYSEAGIEDIGVPFLRSLTRAAGPPSFSSIPILPLASAAPKKKKRVTLMTRKKEGKNKGAAEHKTRPDRTDEWFFMWGKGNRGFRGWTYLFKSVGKWGWRDYECGCGNVLIWVLFWFDLKNEWVLSQKINSRHKQIVGRWCGWKSGPGLRLGGGLENQKNWTAVVRKVENHGCSTLKRWKRWQRGWWRPYSIG